MAQEMDRCQSSTKKVDKIHNNSRGDRRAEGPRGEKSETGAGTTGTGAGTTGTGAGTAKIRPWIEFWECHKKASHFGFSCPEKKPGQGQQQELDTIQ